MHNRPKITVVFAITADGKISDAYGSPGRFGSPADRAHLEQQVALADAVLMGAGTLRAEGMAMPVFDPELIRQRVSRGQSPQPTQIIASASGAINPSYGFFRQAVPRWLLTTDRGAAQWRNAGLCQAADRTSSTDPDYQLGFDRLLIAPLSPNHNFLWHDVLQQLAQEGIQHLALLGGGNLVGSLLSIKAIDELWLTVCPLLVGGSAAPTSMDGPGLPLIDAQWLDLISAEPRGQEVFLHYRRRESC
ncbi:MAG TPA: RibD family protein [Coleofasciculaceae cyanobacterium]